ncbi:MAG TPA: hypothetical protein DCM86_09960, partial [Verrucomicrobiales bacterium]|nr:hypothetical protein [Verrucomicrobiales bacterium]
FSKIEAGKLTLESTDFDLRDTVEGTAEMLAQAARNQGDELVCRIAPEVPRFLRGDPVRIRQVLMNLLSNAIKFTHRGEVSVSLRLLEDSGSRVRLRFEVQDSGIGISDKAKPIIFQAFTQADGSTTRRFGGTGLGLTISKQIVELMEGRIGFESTLGQGSNFWFEVVVAHPSSPPPPALWTGREGLAGRRVLVLDDHLLTARCVADYAVACGMQAEAHTSVEAALQRVRSEAAAGAPWDVVLVDLEMPESDGLSVVQELRSQPMVNPPRLVMLANPGARLDPAVMRANGITACLVKPVKQGRLEEVLVAALKSGAPGAAGEPISTGDTQIVSLAASKARILLAEDNPVNQQVGLRMLKSLGLRADVATNGHEVLAALEREPYDIILMDCQMPEMDGYETSRRIAELVRVTPPPLKSKPFLIAVTANAMAGDREKCLAAGMHDYLSKPLKLIDLSRVLERALLCVHPALEASPPVQGAPAPQESAGESMDLSVIQGLRELREPGQPDPLAQLVDLFLRDSLPRVAQIEAALLAGDAPAAAAAAHTLKGSASNLGARKLAALCATIEKQAKGGDVPAANTVLEPLKGEFQRVQSFLKAEVER